MQTQCRVFGILWYILASQSMVIMPMRCDFNGTKASADSEERSVSVGSRHLHRSPGQEDTKVVRHGQMDSYCERFCETVAMGLPGRVIYLDVVGLEHEADHRMTRNRRGRDMKLSQRLLDMQKKHWEFCSQYCQMLHCLLPVQATRGRTLYLRHRVTCHRRLRNNLCLMRRN